MGMLDGLLAQLGPDFDIANLAAKVGLTKEQVETAVHALGKAHPEPGDTVQTAAASTGLPADILQQIVGHIGGEGALANFATMISSALDKDGDGNPINDLAGLAGSLFGKR